jgi:hypothetical protein
VPIIGQGIGRARRYQNRISAKVGKCNDFSSPPVFQMRGKWSWIRIKRDLGAIH